MSESMALHVALLGNPNCGKTALFNLLTGSRQKVANYAGVTVERKEGHFTTTGGRAVRLLDLPGAYSLNPLSADEEITRDVVTGIRDDEGRPDPLICVTSRSSRDGTRTARETASQRRFESAGVHAARRLGRAVIPV